MPVIRALLSCQGLHNMGYMVGMILKPGSKKGIQAQVILV